MTESQALALEQLKEIQEASPKSRKFEVVQWSETPGCLSLEISIDCSAYEKNEKGIDLKARENFYVKVYTNFPFDYPTIYSSHTRFAGHPHVQWGCQLCLYQASSVEWNASDGMFGFIERLEEWLIKAAKGELDPAGQPLHPPVAYPKSSFKIVPKCNTPPITDKNWFGLANLQVKYGGPRLDIIGWSNPSSKATPTDVKAVAILLAHPMPFEYPENLYNLIQALVERGVSKEHLLALLQYLLIINKAGTPLLAVIGTPMRGIAGSKDLKQHLSVWQVDADDTLKEGLDLSLNAYSDDLEKVKIGERAEAVLWEWAKKAQVKWCRVLEDRPEIINRRDASSALSWFHKKTVAIWGCGAIGSLLAEHIARAGVKKLILFDQGIVSPGVLVRQNYTDEDVAKPKAEALAKRIKNIDPSIEVEAVNADILDNPLGKDDVTSGADIVLDASASSVVREKLELRLKDITSEAGRIPIACLLFGHNAQRGVAIYVHPSYAGGVFDITRKLKLRLCDDKKLKDFLNDFWPEKTQIFQPEPGCSDPTFIGSSADTAALVGQLLNCIASDLSAEVPSHAHLVIQAHASKEEKSYFKFEFRNDIVQNDTFSGYEIRISNAASQEMVEMERQTHKPFRKPKETGGLIFGERNDVLKIIWVSKIAGAPSDSKASSEYFECGVAGTKEMNEGFKKKYKHSIQYLGLWHTHPDSAPLPSEKDLLGIEKVLTEGKEAPDKALFLILGKMGKHETLGVYFVRKVDLARFKRQHNERHTSYDARSRNRIFGWR